MSDLSQELIAVLQFLLPGLFAAWVYYGLTSYSEPSEFERVVQALIFTLLVQAVAYPLQALLLWLGQWYSISPWGKGSELALSVICGFIVGAIISYCANTDCFHKLLRKFSITNETSFPSEWFGAFQKHITYVVLHLSNGNRLYGWPKEWPSDPKEGHFLIEQASWLAENNEQTELTNVACILIPVSDVKFVEFMQPEVVP